MKGKFEGKVTETEKHETEDKHEYAMLKQDLDNQLATASNSRNTKAELKAKALQEGADAKGSLTDVIGTRDADVAYLQDTEAVCSAKSSDFEDRQKLRTEEIDALEQAKGTIAFVQLRSSVRNPNQLHVAAYLQEQGKRLN